MGCIELLIIIAIVAILKKLAPYLLALFLIIVAIIAVIKYIASKNITPINLLEKYKRWKFIRFENKCLLLRFSR